MAGLPPLIRSKTRVPAVAEAVIERDRVVDALRRASEGRRILQVTASAGSGKTTAVVQFVSSRPGPRAWLTLGEADGSPGRFVTYLAASLAAVDPAAPERTRAMLEAGVPPADCAAMLAESLPAGATLVIDDLHLVEHRPPVLAALRALVDAVAPDALVVLVSRRMLHLDLSRAVLTGRAGGVSGQELAFTTDEVGTLLAAHGVERPAEEVVAEAGGWAAGIVFDALHGTRGGEHPAAEDPFFDYLGAEVLGALPADLRHVVVRSSLLHTVEPDGLAALLDLPSADALYAAIRRQHLPATVEAEGLRYHPRFREFLLSLLREDPAELEVLLSRHARRLWSLGQVEDAADHLLAAGAVDEAAGAVEEAGPLVLRRGDWEKVLGWCETLGEAELSARPPLRGVELQAMLVGRRAELPAKVGRLVASGEFARLVARNPEAATTAAFGLHLSGDWSTVRDLLPPDDASPGVRAMRYVLDVGSAEGPPRPWSVADVQRLTPHVGLFQCGLYFQGRFDDVEEMARLDDGLGPVRVANTALYHLSSLRERGRLGDARAVLESARTTATMSGFLDFWAHAEGELVFAEGDRARGLALVREARRMAREMEHRPADRAIFAATEGKMLLRLGRFDEAADLLATTLAWCEERVLPCFGEWAATWLAAARLGRGDDPAVAAALLERAIGGMERAERRLELPAAWVFLAEARWRMGDEEGHDAAADAARDAAEHLGTLGPLLLALEDVPDVLARRIDAAGPDDDRWRALARVGPSPHAASTLDGSRVVVGTLGRPRMIVDGAVREISPPRAIDVAAAVARAGARGVPRVRLVESLAEHSTDAANYLRQVIHRLRRLVPEDVELTSEDGLLRWSPPGAVVAEDDVLRSLLARAERETGPERLDTLGDALALAARGPLTAADETAASRAMSEELSALVAEARRERGALLLAAGRAAEAEAAAAAAVADEPYREDGWRLLMRARAAAAGPSAAVPVFLDCTAALAEIGLEPSVATRELLERLRAAPGPVVSARG